ncbi:DUF983 domain-containing protein [Pseudoblastomonas halimionae]|uniref:DUF983 domain-containing protein n=1 Tax=Alteriqipengyuania halimionae TaxID=1926630 RepID=A0A6I4TZ91_9SPHN|nr:DUF983 domain-containing protein [Alteriqipengyuania halimionae]MXP09020.1 DUF983 domain-containing protein [Alteriqipengyuania halimionae]
MNRSEAETVEPQTGFTPASSNWEAVWRGIRNRCPHCGEATLMPRFLKPVEECPVCGKDWDRHRADDFPAYVSIFLTGHIMAPIMIALATADILSTLGLVLALVIPFAILSIGLIQPAKGAIMALLWRLGVNGK